MEIKVWVYYKGVDQKLIDYAQRISEERIILNNIFLGGCDIYPEDEPQVKYSYWGTVDGSTYSPLEFIKKA